MSREAMQRAFDALLSARDYIYLSAENAAAQSEDEVLAELNDAAAALRAALEAQQEPVAWKCNQCGATSESQGAVAGDNWCSSCGTCDCMAPLFAAPPARKPLTQREVVAGFCETPHQTQYVGVFEAGVRFAERAHGIGGGDD